MGTRLYVGNRPFSADEMQLRDLFSQDGRTVSEVKLVTDPSDRVGGRNPSSAP